MGKKEMTYIIGGTLGLVLGFILAKVYQVWAILYETEGLSLQGVTSWEGKPLWKSINENPGMATFVITFSLFFIGLFFSFLLIRGEKHTQKSNIS